MFTDRQALQEEHATKVAPHGWLGGSALLLCCRILVLPSLDHHLSQSCKHVVVLKATGIYFEFFIRQQKPHSIQATQMLNKLFKCKQMLCGLVIVQRESNNPFSHL